MAQSTADAMVGHDASQSKRPGREALVVLYRTMLRIRHAEQRLDALFADGDVPGFIHLSIGQEAVAAGVMSALRPGDTVASTHRGHGHAIAKGVPLDRFFAELLAKNEGLCRGRGGSMHVADMSVGMLGANGIVAAGLPIALGSALSHKILGRAAIAVGIFGDGALAEGVVHETMNLAQLWRLPLLLVCENNGWGEFLPTRKQLAFELAGLAAAHKIPHQAVDGNHVGDVATAAKAAVERIRGGGGPIILECHTTRARGHFQGDPQKYRTADELAQVAARDPLRVAATLLESQGVGAHELTDMDTAAKAEIESAMQRACAGREPDFAAARADVYAVATVA